MNFAEVKSLIYQGEKINVECKKSYDSLPNDIYPTYSAFANTNGGYIILGVKEDQSKTNPQERYIISGVKNPIKLIGDFWNTINGNKVNLNILRDENVSLVENEGVSLIVIYVPRADVKYRPIFVGEEPFKGTYKRNFEGDYHATWDEIKGMFRDQSSEGNDSLIFKDYTMDDIDLETLKHYRTEFGIKNPDHIWNKLGNKEFLERLGGYRCDRDKKIEGLTLAGIMMFGNGMVIRDVFSNVFMDYRDESNHTFDERWQDRITYDGTWENNLYNFFSKVCPKLMDNIKKPFKLKGVSRIDDTSVHKAVREAFVNLLIHADYQLDSGTLKVLKTKDGFEFSNPGILKLPVDKIYHGGSSKSRNPHIQTMLRMVGFGDNIGSGFPSILAAWKDHGWIEPVLKEDTVLNQVTLTLSMVEKENTEKSTSELILTPRHEEILALIADNPSITRAELSEKMHVSNTTVQKYISQLKALSIIRRIGGDRGGIWEIYRQK